MVHVPHVSACALAVARLRVERLARRGELVRDRTSSRLRAPSAD